MELLKNRIRQDGIALSKSVLLVDSFLNHQVDVKLMREIGREFARLFTDKSITRVVTIESSGIAPAAMTALELNVPLVILKKTTSSILSEDILTANVTSYTKGTTYQLTLKTKYMPKDERVLIIDDFLANGEAAMGAAKLVEMAGATVAGIGIVIEKAFQPGRKRLLDAGHEIVALASVSYMTPGVVEFADD